MADWNHGYVTDIAYTAGAYQETTPSWLAACALLLGYRPPDLTAPFRYADLGCGNGFNALIIAATNPTAEVWGFDFNPAHIEFARMLATSAGLTNAHFVETSFEALARGEDAAGDFDIMVSHGVLSWISLENRRHLVASVARRLRPGGLTYLSYNVTTGWAGMQPIRLLMRQLAETSLRRTDEAVPGIFEVLDQLRTGGAALFQAYPGLEARINQMRGQDVRYIAHEFLNRDWHPVMFAEVAEAMAETRTSYIGSATVMENIDSISVPPALQPLLASTRDVGTRETIRDIASTKGFRRDLWRRGGERLPLQEQSAMVDALVLAGTGKAAEDPITIPGPIGQVTAQYDFYRPLIDAIARAPMTLAQLRALPDLRHHALGEFVQAAILLFGGGYAHPGSPGGDLPAARGASARLNVAIVDRIRVGVDLQRLAAPRIGSGVPINVMEGLVIGGLLGGGSQEPDALIDVVIDDLKRSGRQLMRDGQAVQDAAAVRTLVGDSVREVLAQKLPLLRVLGVID